MSTKTTFKRVALVAVAALGFGMLSVVPSNAAQTAPLYVANTTTTAALAAGTYTAVGSTNSTSYAAVNTKQISAVSVPVYGGVKLDVAQGSTNATFAAGDAVRYVSNAFGVLGSGTFGPDSPTLTVTGVATTTSVVFTTAGSTSGWAVGDTIIGSAGAVVAITAVTSTTVTAVYTSSGAATLGAGSTTLTNRSHIILPIGANLPLLAGTYAGYVQYSPDGGTTWDATSNSAFSITVTGATSLSGNYSTAAAAANADTANNFPSLVPATIATYLTPLNFSKAYTVTEAPVANVSFQFLADAASTPVYGQSWTAVVMSGPGLLGNQTANVGTTGATAAANLGTYGTGYRSVGLTAAQMAGTNTGGFSIFADNTSGTSTINLYTGSTLWKTYTVTFYGTVASIKVIAQNLKVAKASSTGGTLGALNDGSLAGNTQAGISTTAAVQVAAYDANGTLVPGVTNLAVTSADTAVIASGAVVAASAVTDNGPGYYNVNVVSAPAGTSGASATIVVRSLLADGVTYVSSDPITFTLGGSVSTATFTAAMSDASLSAGAPFSLSFTGVDSKGNPIYDQDVDPFLTASFSKYPFGYTQGALSFRSGKATVKNIYAPSIDGDFTFTGVLDSSVVLAGGTVTATGTVNGSNASQAATDAATEATDAANAATDAANAAAEAADAATAAAQDASDAVAALSAKVATLISALKAQLTSLTNLVIKIQKKVKA